MTPSEAATTGPGEPRQPAAAATAPFGLRRHLGLAAFWFGGNYHWGPILSVVLPFQVSLLVPRGEQGSALGLAIALGGIPATIVPPLVGAWSDRLRTRWGRRRPIMVAGTAVNVLGLLLLMRAPSYAWLLVSYLVLQVFNNAAGAAFNALIPDVVPVREFGRQSGILGAMTQLGILTGLATYIFLSRAGQPLLIYAAIAIVLGLSLVPTLLAARGEGAGPPAAGARRSLAAAARDFLAPLWSGDFGWVVFTRLMITGGIWCILNFLQYFFRDVSRIPHADQFTSLWEATLLVAATVFGLAGGWLSDRVGRKPFVYVASAAQGLVVLVFVLFYPSSIPLLFALGILYGLGYGAYYAVDFALACDTLPDRSSMAKDMGLFHVAYTVPQVLLPGILGFVLDAVNRVAYPSGYRVIFAVAIVFYVLGTVLVSRIRGVR